MIKMNKELKIISVDLCINTISNTLDICTRLSHFALLLFDIELEKNHFYVFFILFRFYNKLCIIVQLVIPLTGSSAQTERTFILV